MGFRVASETSNATVLLRMQWEQLQHDQVYHPEILALSVADRMKHMTLHFTKYTGQIAANLVERNEDRMNRVLVDSFIIVLASANSLQLDLGRRLREGGVPPDANLGVIGADVGHTAGRPEAPDAAWLLREYATCGGKLAKACESIDHLESFPFRDAMQTEILALCRLLLAETFRRGFDLQAAVRERLDGVERKNLFHTFHQENASTHA
jgi:hypothetical protein